MSNCVVCGQTIRPKRARAGAATCGARVCHEALVKRMERDFGTHKRVVDTVKGEVHLVPIRDIIERGLKHTHLDRYPTVEPTLEEAASIEGRLLVEAGARPEVRDGKPGLNIGGHFIPVAPPEEMDGILCNPTTKSAGVPGSKAMPCSRCGQAVWVAPTSQVLLREKPKLALICTDCMGKETEAEKGKGADA